MKAILTTMTIVLCIITTLKQLTYTMFLSSFAMFLWPINLSYSCQIIATLLIISVSLSVVDLTYRNTIIVFTSTITKSDIQQHDKE